MQYRWFKVGPQPGLYQIKNRNSSVHARRTLPGSPGSGMLPGIRIFKVLTFIFDSTPQNAELFKKRYLHKYSLQNLYLWIAVKICCLEKSGNVRLNVNFDKILVGYPQNPRRFFQNRIQPSCAPGPILSFLWFFSFLNSIKKIGKLLITWKGSPRF